MWCCAWSHSVTGLHNMVKGRDHFSTSLNSTTTYIQTLTKPIGTLSLDITLIFCIRRYITIKKRECLILTRLPSVATIFVTIYVWCVWEVGFLYTNKERALLQSKYVLAWDPIGFRFYCSQQRAPPLSHHLNQQLPVSLFSHSRKLGVPSLQINYSIKKEGVKHPLKINCD